ncbi:hypothetical protein [Natranaerobius thermophilus]|uniref:Uncharacterized protein n=1 Tax=Natranaerobius thermophilus (strain ATCC BAA-1301 / DSM 18059 / JW/NM-WN-LF) TaxID=457570 RepID=B2A7A3_NATTJ|nr:hypothetical protein [Natranaerobius thermophilus]ACB84297.1 conserved hypothetical protein [Natranaerobius thermophilus JW/NM-WN-LF]
MFIIFEFFDSSSLIIILTSILGGITAYYINIILKYGPVIGSGVVTLLSGVFPVLFGDFGTLLAGAATTSGYASMVSVKHVPSIKEMGALSFLAGSLYLVTIPAFQGIGGKLGTIAALSCLAFIGYKTILSRF